MTRHRKIDVKTVPALVLFLFALSLSAQAQKSLQRGLPPLTRWSPYGLGYVRDAGVRHSGVAGLRCAATASGETHGALCTLTLNQTAPTSVRVSGWSKAQSVDGVTDNDYSVYVDLTFTDGTSLWGQTAPFGTGTHGWQQRSLTVFPTKPLRAMNVYALFRNHGGTAWFDDFEARAIAPSARFDGQEIAPPTLQVGARSGWFIRDVAAGSPLLPLPAGKAVLGVRLDRLETVRGGRVVQATLHNLTTKPRALTAYYVARFAAPQPVWWNDIRSAVPIAPGQEYENLTATNAGATGQISLYPFGCVAGRGAGRTLGLPPFLGPRIARIAFHARSGLLFLACDIALAARGDRSGHDQALVAAADYPSDPAWGFRDAAARWYALFPEAYQRRAKAEGIWMPFTDPSKVRRPEDFGFAYHEGDNSVASDRRLGILSFRYVEPMTYWMPMPKGVPRTYEAALSQVRRQAFDGDETARRQSQAVLTSASRDEMGRFNVSFRNAPWCDGAVWVLNPNPRLPVPSGQWSKARLNLAGGPVPGEPTPPDGEYLDSLEAWADVLDYRPESLTAALEPWTFATDSLSEGRVRPVLPTWFSVYAAASALSRGLHERNGLLMANSVPWRFSAFAPLLDVMGTETNTFSDSGDWQPEPDAVQNLRRTAAYHKPYLLLLNTDFSRTDPAKMELYFQRCLFYGFYPSMFSANAADHPYWEDPHLPDRDRSLFVKYIPLIRRLSASGWEPVTGARADRPDVWLERFGTQYVTVLNAGTSAVDVTVRLDAARFAPTGAGGLAAIRDILEGETLAVLPQAGTLAVRLHLPASAVRVLSVEAVTAKEKQ